MLLTKVPNLMFTLDLKGYVIDEVKTSFLEGEELPHYASFNMLCEKTPKKKATFYKIYAVEAAAAKLATLVKKGDYIRVLGKKDPYFKNTLLAIAINTLD